MHVSLSSPILIPEFQAYASEPLATSSLVGGETGRAKMGILIFPAPRASPHPAFPIRVRVWHWLWWPVWLMRSLRSGLESNVPFSRRPALTALPETVHPPFGTSDLSSSVISVFWHTACSCHAFCSVSASPAGMWRSTRVKNTCLFYLLLYPYIHYQAHSRCSTKYLLNE